MTDSPERPSGNDWPIGADNDSASAEPSPGTQQASASVAELAADSATAPKAETASDHDTTADAKTAVPSEAEVIPKGVLGHGFDLLSYLPYLVLFGIIALQTWFTLDNRALWFSDEIRYANVFEHVLNAKKWIVLYLNGIPYPDKPPVYFWFLRALYPLTGEASPKLFMIGAAASGLLFTWVTYLLARVMGEDRRTGLAAGLVLVSTFFTVGMMHYSRMDLLFATFITLSHLCLYKGWQKDSAFGWIILGFLFAGIATLTKGPLGIAFPVLSTILFALWRFRLKRLLGWDVAIGFGIMTALCLSWVAAAYFTEDHDYLRNIFQQQIIKRATNTWHHGQPWWFYFATLSAVMLPWTLLLITVPWERLFQGRFYKNLWASRQPERMGIAYLWITLLSGFTLLSAVSIKLPVYLLPLFPPLAIICARGILRLTPKRCRLMFRLFALLFAAIAVGLLVVEFIQNPFHVDLVGWEYLAGVAALSAAALWFGAPRRAEGGLLLLVACVTAFILPLGTITAPAMDKVMSPKAQAAVMHSYMQNGFAPASYRIYSGTYSYYVKANIFETNEWDELDAFVAEHPDVVVAIRRKHWDEWPNRPAGMEVVHAQMLVDPKPSNEYLLVVRRAAPELAQPVEAVAPDEPIDSGDASGAAAPDAPVVPTITDNAAEAAPQTVPVQ